MECMCKRASFLFDFFAHSCDVLSEGIASLTDCSKYEREEDGFILEVVELGISLWVSLSCRFHGGWKSTQATLMVLNPPCNIVGSLAS
jgi:hypothetical protein